MDTSQTTELPVLPRNEEAGVPATEFTHCDVCGAPVDHVQRYCVDCGAHRKHVDDPAARYLSQTSARARQLRSAAPARPAAMRRSSGVVAAAALALIPIAAVIGVQAGRSSNNQDARLIQALAHPRTETIVSSAAAAGGASGPTRAGARSRAKAGRAAKAHRSTSSTAGKVVATTQYGSATQVAGSKVSASQSAQGAADAQKIQNSTGKNYVQAANNLPSTVVP